MKLFENYLNGISDIVNKRETRTKTFSSFSGNEYESLSKGLIYENRELQKSGKVLMEFDSSQLTTLFGNNPSSFDKIRIGTHPDFENIGFNEFENHYCVTMFMDIRGSTRLNGKYSLFEIRKIKDTLLTLAIYVSSHFGGHIHRLQGDGIFIQFVRKRIKEQDAVINALNAASILTHFVSSDLAEIFKDIGIDPLKIRIGIDLGFKEDVLWSHYGVPACSELTTTSLHTDLASKLQANAPSNGILVGNNIKEVLDIKPEFCQDVRNSDGETDYYIFKGFINYRKYNFNWINYLKSFDFVKLNSDGKKLEIFLPNIRIKCFVSDENGNNEIEYFQNSYAIPKNYQIRYVIYENDHKYFIKQFERIEWYAHNSGSEAKKAEQEFHDFGKKYINKNYCETSAAYKGHHFVECKIKREHLPSLKITFPIFVE